MILKINSVQVRSLDLITKALHVPTKWGNRIEIDSWEERELLSERRLGKGAMVMQMGLSRTPDSSPGRS